jgi:hypothetical protein
VTRIRIPLSVDAQLRIPLGPIQAPVRTCIALGVAILPACIAFELPLSLGLRFAAVVGVFGTAIAIASPMREGVWVGTVWALQLLGRWLPSDLAQGGVVVTEARAAPAGWRRWAPRVPALVRIRVARLWHQFVDPIRRVDGGDTAGLFCVEPGGWRAVVSLQGPPTAIDSATYASWCRAVVGWVRQLDTPAQFVAAIGHVNRDDAERAFDGTCAPELPHGPLRLEERRFAGEMATQSLAFTHHVVLAPRLVSREGMPGWFRPAMAASRTEAEHILAAALTSGRSAGLVVEAAQPTAIGAVLATSHLGDHATSGASFAANGRAPVHVAGLAVTRLGQDADFGMLVDVIQRSGMHGAVSLHLLPTTRATVRRFLTKRRLWLRYALREGRPDIDLEVSLQDTEQLQVELAAGRVEGLRVAITLRLTAATAAGLDEQAERLGAIVTGHGWHLERLRTPALLPATAGAPGTAPLRRGLLLTTDAVAARLLPALGTPFADVGDPLVGANLRAGSSAYLSVFTRPNFNAVIVGSSGAGKSVTAKTLLARHVMRGAGACILDPDSEYGDLVGLLGGCYFELPDAALNPLALGSQDSCDLAAGRIVPVLSVMAGDETEYVGGRPIRRLPNEDKAWLHASLREFLTEWRAAAAQVREPLLQDFLCHLETVTLRDRRISPRVRDRYERIALRLRGFTQGQLGQIFDRPSTFAIRPGTVTGIGFRALSLAYAADLTPALCVVLSHVLDAILTVTSLMVILVDEAHVLTSDPDAGQVLEQLVRRARKCRAGVWMASQRIEEFTATDLGRTLASTAATKVVLGHEDTVAERVRSLFDLADDESAALTPPVPGQAVLISGRERTIVQVLPSPVLWPFIGTQESPLPSGTPGESAPGHRDSPGAPPAAATFLRSGDEALATARAGGSDEAAPDDPIAVAAGVDGPSGTRDELHAVGTADAASPLSLLPAHDHDTWDDSGEVFGEKDRTLELIGRSLGWPPDDEDAA